MVFKGSTIQFGALILPNPLQALPLWHLPSSHPGASPLAPSTRPSAPFPHVLSVCPSFSTRSSWCPSAGPRVPHCRSRCPGRALGEREGEGPCASPFPVSWPPSAQPKLEPCSIALSTVPVGFAPRDPGCLLIFTGARIHHHPLNHGPSPALSLQLPQSVLQPQPSDGPFPSSRASKGSHCPFDQIRPSRVSRPNRGRLERHLSSLWLLHGSGLLSPASWTTRSYPSLAGPLTPQVTAPRPFPLEAPCWTSLPSLGVLQHAYLFDISSVFVYLSICLCPGSAREAGPFSVLLVHPSTKHGAWRSVLPWWLTQCGRPGLRAASGRVDP